MIQTKGNSGLGEVVGSVHIPDRTAALVDGLNVANERKPGVKDDSGFEA